MQTMDSSITKGHSSKGLGNIQEKLIQDNIIYLPLSEPQLPSDVEENPAAPNLEKTPANVQDAPTLEPELPPNHLQTEEDMSEEALKRI